MQRRKTHQPRKLPLWSGLRLHVVAAHFGTLGYVGQGPPRRAARNPGGVNGFNKHIPPGIPEAVPSPHTPAEATTSTASPASCTHPSTGKRGGPVFFYTTEWVAAKLEQEDGLALITGRLNDSSRRARGWKRQAQRTQGCGARWRHALATPRAVDAALKPSAARQ